MDAISFSIHIAAFAAAVTGSVDAKSAGVLRILYSLKRRDLQEYDSLGFRVVAENQPMKELLVTRIFEEEVFQRQGGPD